MEASTRATHCAVEFEHTNKSNRSDRSCDYALYHRQQLPVPCVQHPILFATPLSTLSSHTLDRDTEACLTTYTQRIFTSFRRRQCGSTVFNDQCGQSDRHVRTSLASVRYRRRGKLQSLEVRQTVHSKMAVCRATSATLTSRPSFPQSRKDVGLPQPISTRNLTHKCAEIGRDRRKSSLKSSDVIKLVAVARPPSLKLHDVKGPVEVITEA